MNLHNLRSSNASSKRDILEIAQKRNSVYTDMDLGRLNATIDMRIGAGRLERIRASIDGYNINLDNPLFKCDPDMPELEKGGRAGLRLPVIKRAGSFSITDYNQENKDVGIPVEKILRQRRSSVKPPKAIIKSLPMNNPGHNLYSDRKYFEPTPGAPRGRARSLFNPRVDENAKTNNKILETGPAPAPDTIMESPENHMNQYGSHREVARGSIILKNKRRHNSVFSDFSYSNQQGGMGAGAGPNLSLFYGQKKQSLFKNRPNHTPKSLADDPKNKTCSVFRKGQKEDVRKYIIKKSDPDSVEKRRRDRSWNKKSGEGSYSESESESGNENEDFQKAPQERRPLVEDG